MYSEKFTGTYSSWKGPISDQGSIPGHTSRKENPSSSAEQLRDQIRALFQFSSFSTTRLGVSLGALASFILPILPHRNFDIWAISKIATAVQNVAPLPLSESFSPGVAFWNPTVEFARDRFGQFGEHFGPTPQGRVSAKWRMQIVRQVMPGYLLTSVVETNGDRGLYGSHIDASTHWQYLRVADIRDQRPLNHSPHAPLRLDKTGSNTQMRDSSNGYVHAGVIQKCIPVDTWTFAGRLTSDSLRMLDALSKEVLTATDGLPWHKRHLLNFEAIHRGQFELDHPLPPRNEGISPAQNQPRPSSRYGHESDAPQGSYQHRFPEPEIKRYANLPRNHTRTYAQTTGQRLHPAVSAPAPKPTSTVRKETNLSLGTQHPSSNPQLPLDEQTLKPLPAPIQPVSPKQHTQPAAPVQSPPRNPTDATTRAQSPPASASSDHSQTVTQTSRDGDIIAPNTSGNAGVNQTSRDGNIIAPSPSNGNITHITINMSPPRDLP